MCCCCEHSTAEYLSLSLSPHPPQRRRGQTTLDAMLQRGSSEGEEGETQFPSLAEITQVRQNVAQGHSHNSSLLPLFKNLSSCLLLLLSLLPLTQELISKALSSPHSPYLPLSSVWPPHSNLLLRSGVIQRHPDNPSLIRITPFHL